MAWRQLVTREEQERFPLSPATRGCHRQNSDCMCGDCDCEGSDRNTALPGSGSSRGQVRGHINTTTLESWKGFVVILHRDPNQIINVSTKKNLKWVLVPKYLSVLYTCSLMTLPLLSPLIPLPLLSGYCQFVFYFNVSGCILFCFVDQVPLIREYLSFTSWLTSFSIMREEGPRKRRL